MIAKFIVIIIFSYVAGSINFSIILFRLVGRGDPRTGFSGNAGVTNVYRQAGMLWAAVILALDMGRAVGVAAAAVYFLPGPAVPWAGVSLVAGNRFPVFHGFRGGKGVANYLGFTAYLYPAAAAAACAVWVAVYGIARVPFVASFFMVAVLAGGAAMVFWPSPAAITGTAATFLLIVANHARNIGDFIRERKR